jgi:hypothetical protein
VARSMKTTGDPWTATEKKVCELLERHNCPLTFPRVRTRLVGYEASPIMYVSPVKVVDYLWGDKLPRLARIHEYKLRNALVFGLWNRLTRHHDVFNPFRLLKSETASTRAGLVALALMRREELDGFLEGIFVYAEIYGPAELMPKRAHQGRASSGGCAAISKRWWQKTRHTWTYKRLFNAFAS